MGRASTEELDNAFTAGFEDKDIKLDPSAEIEDPTPVVPSTAETLETAETIKAPEAAKVDEDPVAPEKVAEAPTDGDPIAEDEWAGVPDSVRKHFDDMAANLEKVTNIANSASGRANKLQSRLDKKEAEPTPEPVVTSDTLLKALQGGESRDKLREDFGEFAAALDELDKNVSSSVGSAVDNLRNEIRQEFQTTANSQMQNFEIKRSLDIKHPGWENTVQQKDFKTWAYEGGPSEQESNYYESLLVSAGGAAPEDSAALYDQANTYYNTLLETHPVWANEKGKLYGDSSGTSAISLLDLYETNKTPAPAPVAPVASTFEDNLAPTSGGGRQAPVITEDAEKAFNDGFNS